MKLTPREIEALQLLTDGECDKQAAAAMGITTRTLRAHLANARRKLGTQSRFRCVALAVTRGLVITDNRKLLRGE